MSFQDIGLLIGILSGLGSLLALFFTRTKDRADAVERSERNAERIARIEVKVDTLWDFQMRRAVAEAVTKGVASVNSPVKVNGHAMKWAACLADELQSFYARAGSHLCDRDLYIELERQFGDRILMNVCIPKGISHGACLLIAAAVARDGEPNR